MAYPPKGHPDRPLRLAASSMLTLGVLLILLSTCVGIAIGSLGFGGSPAARAGAPAFPRLILLGVLLVYLAPGVGFIVCSVALKRYKAWAAIVGLVLTGLALLGSLLMLLSFLATALSGDGGGGGGGPGLIVGLIPLLFVAAFTQLIFHLSKSFTAIRLHHEGDAAGHGFQPLPADDLFSEAVEAEEADNAPS